MTLVRRKQARERAETTLSGVFEWLVRPWKAVLQGRLRRRHIALVLGVATSLALIYLGTLFLSGSSSLNNRSVLSVLVSPDRRDVTPSSDVKSVVDSNSAACRASTPGNTPSAEPLVRIAGARCVSWRQVGSFPPGCVVSRASGPATQQLVELLGRSRCRSVSWQGSLVSESKGSGVSFTTFMGNSRSDGIDVLKENLWSAASRLAIIGGVMVAVAIGASIGYQFLQKDSDVDS